LSGARKVLVTESLNVGDRRLQECAHEIGCTSEALYAHLFYKLSVFIKNYTYRKREREKEEVNMNEALGKQPSILF